MVLTTWWTWHDLNVRPRPSQSRALIPLSYRSFDLGFLNADCGFEINLHSAIINRLAEGTGLEPASDKCAVVFKTTALPVRLPFQKQNDLWSSFLNFETFRTQMGEPSTRIKVLRSKYKVLPLGACDRTRTYEVVGRLISKEGAFAAQPHMRNEISNFKFEDSKRFQI